MREFWDYQLCGAQIIRVLDEGGGRVKLVLDGVDASSEEIRAGTSSEVEAVSLDVRFTGVPEEAVLGLCSQEGHTIRDFSYLDIGNGENTAQLNGISFPYERLEWVEGELPQCFFEIEPDPAFAGCQWIFDSNTWDMWMIFPRETEVYDAAKSVVNPRKLTEYAEAGGVGAAIFAANGEIYTGVCIDVACSIGFCAEHAAAAAMITAGESQIYAVAAVGWDGKIMPPCGRCREFLTALHPNNRYASVLLPGWKTCTLEELLPYDWKKFEEGST